MKTPLTNPKFKRTVDIINSIEQDIQLEKGIVPLIGAGMSAHSGIPAGVDYFSYLFYCLTRVIGIDTNGEQLEQWDPSTLRWPNYLEMPAYKDFDKDKLNWCNKIMAEINSIELLNAKYNKEDKSTELDNDSIYLYTQALGVVSDWRSTLDLLSRMKLSNEIKKNGLRKIILKQPDEKLIDSFFVNLTKGKKPNSSHMLLAHISDILRIKTILTTNFDSLIENAYQKLINPIAVFDVHLDARLPDADFVRAQRSVVKMHGGRYGLRADFSLDKAPLKDDVEQFINYVSFYKPKEERNKLKTQRNLLVMGVSPSSKRVMDLMCHALARLKNLKIYWICYKEDDRKKVWESFGNTIAILDKNGEIDESFCKDWNNNGQKYLDDRLFITSVPDLTTFLLEVYQQVFLSLPPAGIQFSSVWPFPAKPWGNTNEKLYDHYKSILIKQLESRSNIIYLHGANGISALASDVFYDYNSKKYCFWFNLNEIFFEVDFIYSLINAVASKIGYSSLIPVKLIDPKTTSFRNIRNQFLRVVKYCKRPIFIFINYREITYNENEQNNVLKKTFRLINLLKFLKHENVKFIVLGHPDPQKFGKETEIIHIKEDIAEKFNVDEFFTNLERNKDLEIAKRFLLSLSLVRNISYLSLLHTWSFVKAKFPLASGNENEDNDQYRFKYINNFLDRINQSGLFRSDDNHFVYVPFRNRTLIQEYLSKNYDGYILKKAESHQGIADWYMKLYRSSGDIHAMAESIYHRFECFKTASELSVDQNASDMERFMITALIEMEQAITLARESVFSSFQLLSIHHSLEAFCIQLKDKSESINPKNWYSFKLESISKNLFKLQSEFSRKMGYNFSESIEKSTKVNSHNIYDSIIPGLRIIKSQIKSRQYSIALSLIEDSYRDLDFKVLKTFFKKEEKGLELLTENIRESVRNWINSNLKGDIDLQRNAYEKSFISIQPLLENMVRLFRLHQWLLLLESQVFRYLDKGINGDHDTEINSKLKEAEIIYICSTEMMRYITNIDFINSENAKLRSNTGIMLSWMKRHHEAYRRYNEAYGYLNFGDHADSPFGFGIIDLRRAETFISKIEQQLHHGKENKENSKEKPLTSASEIEFGFLYDAIASADRGESRMKGNSISIWWHCWTVEMQMLICAKIKKLRKQICKELDYPIQDKYDLFGHCRECEVCGQRFIKNLEKGLEIVGDDLLRLARYMELTKEFADSSQIGTLAKRFRESQQQGKAALFTLIIKSEIEKSDPSKKVEIDPNVKEYVTTVLKELATDSF